jgi:hypothetical protein
MMWNTHNLMSPVHTFYGHTDMVLEFGWVIAGNTNGKGRLGTVDLIYLACFVSKVNNIFNVKSRSWSKLVMEVNCTEPFSSLRLPWWYLNWCEAITPTWHLVKQHTIVFYMDAGTKLIRGWKLHKFACSDRSKVWQTFVLGQVNNVVKNLFVLVEFIICKVALHNWPS